MKSRLTILGLTFFAISATAIQAAVSIGWNYVGRSATNLGSGETAGAPGFAQDNWNNHAGSGQGVGTTPFNNLVDDSGAPTTMDVTAWSVSTANSWNHGESGTPNHVLMDDFVNKEPSITFADIPFAQYTVVVYYGDNEVKGGTTNQSFLDVGSLTRTISTGNSAASSFGNVGFVEGTDLNFEDPTNYSVFTGLSDSSLTVSLTAFDQGDINNHGISAIQFIQVPEPGSTGLLMAGVCVLTLRRRRR